MGPYHYQSGAEKARGDCEDASGAISDRCEGPYSSKSAPTDQQAGNEVHQRSRAWRGIALGRDGVTYPLILPTSITDGKQSWPLIGERREGRSTDG